MKHSTGSCYCTRLHSLAWKPRQARTSLWWNFGSSVRFLIYQWPCQTSAQIVRLHVYFNTGKKLFNSFHCRQTHKRSEVAGVTFSDSESAPVPKFLNPGPVILQIWESDSCSDSATIIYPTVIYPCFYLRNDRTDSCYCRYGEVTPGPVFHKFLTPGPDPGPKDKRRILPESTPVIRILSHLCTRCK